MVLEWSEKLLPVALSRSSRELRRISARLDFECEYGGRRYHLTSAISLNYVQGNCVNCIADSSDHWLTLIGEEGASRSMQSGSSSIMGSSCLI